MGTRPPPENERASLGLLPIDLGATRRGLLLYLESQLCSKWWQEGGEEKDSGLAWLPAGWQCFPVFLPPWGTVSISCTCHTLQRPFLLPGAPFSLFLLDHSELLSNPQGPDTFISLCALLAIL